MASFFVSRVDTEVDSRLDKIGTAGGRRLRGKAAMANARLAYQRYEQIHRRGPMAGPGAAAGARPQRPLWASTSIKDPAYADTRYVDDLVAPDVVNTMPEATLQRGGRPRAWSPADTIHGTYPQAHEVLERAGRA